MFTFDFLMSIMFKVWVALFIGMILRIIFKSIFDGIKRGCMISTIKTNVQKRIEEYDSDLKKYYDYEVEENDISDMYK